MSCWDRFDFRMVQMFSGHPKRTVGIREELKRVGCGAQEFWESPHPFYAFAKKLFMYSGDGVFNATLGRYRLMKVAYDLGAQHLLVLENDLRFLRDVGDLHRRIDEIPEDYDFAALSWQLHNGGEKDWDRLKEQSVNQGGWAKKVIGACGFAAYAVSRRFLKWLIWKMDNAAAGKDRLTVCDLYMDRTPHEFNLYLPIPPLAVQGTVDQTEEPGCSDGRHKIDLYSACGFDMEKYACP
jgi:hypothetical protein